jgi:hypothetical protein
MARGRDIVLILYGAWKFPWMQENFNPNLLQRRAEMRTTKSLLHADKVVTKLTSITIITAAVHSNPARTLSS